MPDYKYFSYLLIIFLFIISLKLPINAAENNDDVYKSITAIERQIYNKDYIQENFYLRLDRVERSVFNKTYKDSIYDRLARIQQVLTLSKSLKINNERQNILDLLENRYFGTVYRDENLEKRLSRLEEVMLDRVYIGSNDFRFDNLIKQIPASNQQKILDTSAKIKKSTDSNYYIDVEKVRAKEIISGKDFPIKIYIFPETEVLLSSAKKAVQIWSEYIQVAVTDEIKDADIVISWKKHYTNIVKLEKTEEDKYQYYIYTGKYTGSDFLNKFLVHQIGHSLGIWGHSSNKNDIMYPFKEFKSDLNFRDFNDQYADINVKYSPSRPSNRDINTLIKIYGK